ncbi:hypothetical protein llg_37090 [Luteolibacter sp. LG18]|nr:hypothetical protein llg_37090 [Luteolibacter sp. LG18]
MTAVTGFILWENRANQTLVLAWWFLNAVLTVSMLLGAVWNLRTVFQSRGTLVRWSFWAALILTFSGFSESLESSGHPVSWLYSGSSYLALLLVVFPAYLAGALVLAVVGAGGGALSRGGALDRAAAVRSGIRWIWLVAAVVWLLRLIPQVKEQLLLVAGIPWFFLCLLPFLAHGTRRAVLGRFDLWLAKHFRWKIGRHVLDLRAEVFAAAGFLIAWGLVSVKVFQPFQASSLQSAIQIINGTHPRDMPDPSPLVLVEWDAASRRAATTRESEASVQAKMILRLAELGARRVVLPMPADRALDEDPEMENLLPGPMESEWSRTERDISSLETAMRSANNVVLIAPPPNEAASSPGFGRLKGVAREVASPGLRWFMGPSLPTVAFTWPDNEPTPAPLLLFAASRDHEGPATPVFPDKHLADFDGKRFPLIDGEGNLLVDLVGSHEGRDFAQVSYSDVLRGEWQFKPGKDRPGGKGRGSWEPPEKYFKDKIVFLPPLRSSPIAGPLGDLERTELLAQATRTLKGHHFLHPAPRGTALFWAFACALAIGRLAMRREPLKAGWRLLMVLGFIFGLSLVMFAVADVWLDPVLPSASALASFLLVTQLSFSLERAAKERNRSLLHRFLDPGIARELFDSQQSRLGLGGDRENVVILFADVRGFSRFAESHPPEDVMRVVNAYLGVMTDALHARGGLLDKYTGDGLMAMFRLERSGSIAGAVDAALAMRDAALALSRELRAEGEKSLRVGISLHAGEAVVGLVGNADRQVNFTALGHVVVVAARLQALTGGGEVIVSKEIHDAVNGDFKMEPRPEVHVKGVSQPVKPYVVLGK